MKKLDLKRDHLINAMLRKRKRMQEKKDCLMILSQHIVYSLVPFVTFVFPREIPRPMPGQGAEQDIQSAIDEIEKIQEL